MSKDAAATKHKPTSGKQCMAKKQPLEVHTSISPVTPTSANSAEEVVKETKETPKPQDEILEWESLRLHGVANATMPTTNYNTTSSSVPRSPDQTLADVEGGERQLEGDAEVAAAPIPVGGLNAEAAMEVAAPDEIPRASPVGTPTELFTHGPSERPPLIPPNELRNSNNSVPESEPEAAPSLLPVANERHDHDHDHAHALNTTGELVQATLIRDIDDTSQASLGADMRSLPLSSIDVVAGEGGGAPLTVVEAKPVDPAPTKTMSRKLICGVMAVLLLVIAALSVGFVVSGQRGEGDEEDATTSITTGNTSSTESTDGGNATILGDDFASPGTNADPSMNPTATRVPILDRLRQGGILRCGVFPNPGLYELGIGGGYGFDASLCAAIAAAATGDPNRVEYNLIAVRSVFETLHSGEVDIVSAGVTHTMERQVYESNSQASFAFTIPYLYQGMQLAGEPTLVECGDKGLEFIAACGSIQVCVIDGSTHQQMLSSFLPGQKMTARGSGDELREGLANGSCNVIAHEGYNLAESLVREAGYEGDYLIGQTLFSKEPLAMVTAAEDSLFSDFANVVLNSLIVAEANGITQSTANLMDQTTAFGPEHSDMFRNAVAAGGNYGELYARHLQAYSPRQGLNQINFGNITDTGLMYSHPFGSISSQDGEPGETLSEISRRGTLRCGVRSNRPGFAELAVSNSTGEVVSWSGLEVAYCRALAASVFAGNAYAMEVIEVVDQDAAFALLAAGELDVVAGVTWTLTNEMRVPEVAEGFAFTQPYFFGSSDNGVGEANLCLATKQGDHLWSSFVYWVTAAVVQAEETGMTQGMSNGMPNVNLFGPVYELMFQDAILAIGNYAEAYERHLATRIPRTGRNLLNGNGGPQLYPMPGIMDLK